MDISNMLLENLKGKALEEIANKVGGDTATTKAIASKALPMLLGQLSKNVEDESEAENLNNALNDHLGESKIDIDDGMNILGHIFGNKDEAVEQVAQASGQSSQQAGGVMAALSSVIMETLGDQKKAAGGFQAQDLVKLLSGTGKDANILEMVLDQDGDGDFDMQDGVTFGMNWLKNKLRKK